MATGIEFTVTDILVAINGVIAVGGALALWVMKIMWGRMDSHNREMEKIQRELTDLRVEVAQDYVRWGVLNDIRKEILEELNKIEKRIEVFIEKAASHAR
jgi:dynactin complex subunit